MISPEEKGDEGQAAADPTASPNKHLTRLVRFSILQARRSAKGKAPPPPPPPPPPAVGTKQAASSSSVPRGPSPSNNNNNKSKRNSQSPLAEPAKLPYGFTADKERPSTEVQYSADSYSDAPPGHVGVPGDPPIMEDLSQSFTQGSGDVVVDQQHPASYYSHSHSYSDDGVRNEDMDMLLAPDSGDGGHNITMLTNSMESSTSNYNSAEMYSSSSNYEGGSHSTDSSDSIMRRVEEEIANARKASSDAQARLAYFTQRQKDLTPVMTDSYSFDFDTLVDASGEEDVVSTPALPQRAVSAPAISARREAKQRGMDPPTAATEDSFNNAMGVIGQEFDVNNNSQSCSADIEEKLDIEVVLAPSESQATSPRSQTLRSPRHQKQRSPRHQAAGSPSPRHHADDSLEIDEAVISAVFSEKSIESLPVKESLHAVFSEQSMESLPAQPTANIGIEKPGSFSFLDAAHPNMPLSPGTATKRPSKVSDLVNQYNHRQSPSKLTINTEAQAATSPRAASIVSPVRTVGSASPGSRRSKLPSTPREPGTPSYRERLENKLKILGSRYPASPVRNPASPKSSTASKAASSSETKLESAPQLPSPTKTPRSLPPLEIPTTPKDTISSPVSQASPLGEAYDGLENRIKDLLARTLSPTPADIVELSDQDAPTSPSAELKAIKKLLEQGVTAAVAAEEKKKGKEVVPTLVAETNAQMASLNLYGGGKEYDLNFPVLDGTPPQEEKSTKEQTNAPQQAEEAEANDIRLLPRSFSAPVVPAEDVSNSVQEAYVPAPSIVCSTSEEILEQLDSFSQSTEFKAKARKPSKTKTSPSKSNKQESGEKEPTVSTIQQILDQPIPNPISEIQSIEDKPVPSDEICQDNSLISPLSDGAPAIWERCESDTENDEDGEICISDALPGESDAAPKEHRGGSSNRNLDEANAGNAATTNIADMEANAPISPKKTPSVLNLALSRPSPSFTEEKECKNIEASIESKKKSSANMPQQGCSDDKDQESPANTPAPESSEKKQNKVNDKEQILGEQKNDENTTSQDSSAPAMVHPEFGNETGTPIHLGEESMLASLIAPSSINSEMVETKPKTATDNDEEPENASPQARVKSVKVVEPKKSSDQEDTENAPPNKTENPKSRPSSRQDRKIRFRDPYPTPKPCRKSRTTEEIQSDSSCMPTQKDYNTKWKDPKGDLKRLLVAALDSSVSRRSNACGALKVISKLDKNKVILVRTKGFLDALVFVATDEVSSDDDEAKEDARARAISCIYNVSHVKENRLTVCMHPGLLESLVKTLSEDRGEARMEACGALAQLAKNSMCREYMVQVDDLLSTLASVLKGTIDPEEKMMDMISQDFTDEVQSSYSHSEMSSVLSEEHIPFPKKSPRSPKHDRQVLPNCSIRKQKSDMYDQYFNLARLSACAALIHLSKQCSILDHFCSNMFLLESIVQVSRDFDSQLHCKCLEILCNISRLPGNTAAMTLFPGMVDTLLAAGSSKDDRDRVWAVRTLQNMSSDSSSKATLATGTLLTLLITCVTSKNTDEQHAAMATLLNLSTDPSAVVPITSTKNVLATLVYLAHNADSSADIRLMACNALATVGLWLQTVSGFGCIPEDARRVLLPSHKTSGWDNWE